MPNSRNSIIPFLISFVFFNFDIDRFEVAYVKVSDEKLVRLQDNDLKKFVK